MSKDKRAEQDNDFPVLCQVCGKKITFDTAYITLKDGMPVWTCETCSKKLNPQNHN